MIPRLGRQLSAWATSLRTKVCHRFVSLRLPDAKPLWATVNLHGAPVRPTPGGQRPLPVRRTRSTPEYRSEALPFGLFAPKFAENIRKCKFTSVFCVFALFALISQTCDVRDKNNIKHRHESFRVCLCCVVGAFRLTFTFIYL